MKLGVNDVNAKESKENEKVASDSSKKAPSSVDEGAEPKPAKKTGFVAEKHQDTLTAIAVVVGGAAWWLFR